jgi:DNA-binding NarL/FixJ family response regulator
MLRQVIKNRTGHGASAPDNRSTVSGETQMSDASARVLVADDHPLFRGAMRQAVGAALAHPEIQEAGSFDDVTRCLASGAVDLILLDLNMPGMQGFSGLAYLRASHPESPILIVSGADNAQVVRRCMDFGAAGFLPKREDIETMRDAIRTVLAGGVWTPVDYDPGQPEDRETSELLRRLASLTPQQVRVLMMLSEGKLNKQIAYELDVSEATVKAHVSAILTKLDVDSRTQAVIAASRIDVSQWQPAETPPPQ